MRARAGAAAGALVALAASACVTSHSGLPPWQPIEAPSPDRVEAVLFLAGDAGESVAESTPLIARLRQEVESWAARLPRDSAVVVLYLGDDVYPAGVHAPWDPLFAADSTHLAAQLDAVSGPVARRRGARAYFVAGNHDWGNQPGAAGIQRLENLQAMIDRARARGIAAWLRPAAGEGGPVAVDVGRHLRLLLLDTAWWLYEAEEEPKGALLAAVEGAIRAAGGRSVILAAHHPFASGGPHGGLIPFWQGLGVQWLLYKSGALLQDLNSIPFKELHNGLLGVFARTGAPLAFAAGHDHSLQVLRDTAVNAPRWALVSGSASKRTRIGWDSRMRFRRSSPGFMRIEVRGDGRVALFVEAADNAFASCPAGPDLAKCMADGVAAFSTAYSAWLK